MSGLLQDIRRSGDELIASFKGGESLNLTSRYQNFDLASNLVGPSTGDDIFAFNHMVIGKGYRITFSSRVDFTTAGHFVGVRFRHKGVTYNLGATESDAANTTKNISFSWIFTAEVSDAQIEVAGVSGGSHTFVASGSTRATIEELPNAIEVDVFS